jgi:hypothetical protein
LNLVQVSFGRKKIYTIGLHHHLAFHVVVKSHWWR